MANPLFPGTFDPPTLGHVDLALRGLELFGRVTVAVGRNSSKAPLLDAERRVELLRASLGERPGISVLSFEGLLVDYCRDHGHDVILRGLRSVGDLEYEMAMTQTNRALAPEIETVFLLPRVEHGFTSSSLIKEIVRHGGDASRFLPAPVIAALRETLESN